MPEIVTMSTDTLATVSGTGGSIHIIQEPPAISRLVKPLPVMVAETPDEDLILRYRQIADRVGLLTDSIDLKEVMFAKALRRHEIAIYGEVAVETYLAELCKTLNSEVAAGKRPRPADWGPDGKYRWTWLRLPIRGTCFNELRQDGTEYEEIVPIEALEALERVKALVPAKEATTSLAFVVGTVKSWPDPFLAALYGRSKWVFFHWNEPGFSIAGK